MSQNDFTLANQGFPSMRADMNSAYQALASNNSGATAPTTTFAHQWWYDTTNSLLMIRNAGNTAFEEFSAGGGGIVYVEKTANYTAAAGEGIIADTSSGSWTLTLPATPASGDVVVIADGADWATNNLTVGRNGNTIEGNSSDLVLNRSGISVTFIYASNNWQAYSSTGSPSDVVVTETGTQTLTNKTIGSSQLTGALPAISGDALTSLTSAALTGALPAISGAALTGITSSDVINFKVQTITSSTTVDIQAGVSAFIYAAGAGGSGGTATRRNSSAGGTAASGGAAGGSALKYLASSGSDRTLTLTVGAGGAGSSSSSDQVNNGNSGGTTSVTGTGISLSCTGGGAGSASRSTSSSSVRTAAGAAGGTGTGGDVNTTGGSTGDIIKSNAGAGTNVGAGAIIEGGTIAGSTARLAAQNTQQFVPDSTTNLLPLFFTSGAVSSLGTYFRGGTSQAVTITSSGSQSGGGSGGATCMSSDSSTGTRSASSATGGTGFVQIIFMRDAANV